MGLFQITFDLKLSEVLSNGSFNKVQEGIVTTIKKKFNNKIDIIIYNAEGSMLNAHAMANNLHSNNEIVAICSIGTLATQAIAQVEKKKPIILSAVSAPETLNITYPGTNVCGYSDLTNVSALINTVEKILPHVKKIALIYNPSESNAMFVAKKIESFLSNTNISLLHIGINHESEIIHAMQNAVNKADVIILPPDTTTAAAIEIIAKLALQKNIPVITGWEERVVPGIVAAAGGSDYHELGILAGKLVIEIINNHKKPDEISIIYPLYSRVVIHKPTANQLGIIIPEDLLPNIEWRGV